MEQNFFKIKNESNEYMFLELTKVVTGILAIPHSSANVERIVSYQKRETDCM